MQSPPDDRKRKLPTKQQTPDFREKVGDRRVSVSHKKQESTDQFVEKKFVQASKMNSAQKMKQKNFLRSHKSVENNEILFVGA